MELTEKAAIEVLTTYAPQVGEGNNWNLLIEAIRKFEREKIPKTYAQYCGDLLEDIKWTGLVTLDYEKTFWAVVEAINFINELKNEEQ